MKLHARIARLEGQREPGGVFVVQGLTHVEDDERIAELIAAGVATPNSLFVCIMKRGELL